MKQTNQSPVGTSFHDTVINTTVNKLIKAIGKPYMHKNLGDDKINFEWRMELEDGTVFTVYDYKEYRKIDLDELIEFHIGGFNAHDTEKALIEICRAIDNTKDQWDEVIAHYKGTKLSHWNSFTEWDEDHHEFITFLKKHYDAPVTKPVEEKPEIVDVDYYTVNVFHVNYKGTEYVVRYNGDYDDYLIQEWEVLDEDGDLPPQELAYKLIDYCSPKVKTIES
jgi:hypothetical protein